MDKIVSLLQWHSFIQFFSREELRETRLLRSQDPSILASSDIHGQGHSAFIHSAIIQFVSSREERRETRLLRSQMQSASQDSRIFSIHSWPGPFNIHYSFDSTGEALGDPHTRMSLRLRNLRDLSHEGMACLEGGVVS